MCYHHMAVAYWVKFCPEFVSDGDKWLHTASYSFYVSLLAWLYSVKLLAKSSLFIKEQNQHTDIKTYHTITETYFR